MITLAPRDAQERKQVAPKPDAPPVMRIVLDARFACKAVLLVDVEGEMGTGGEWMMEDGGKGIVPGSDSGTAIFGDVEVAFVDVLRD